MKNKISSIISSIDIRLMFMFVGNLLYPSNVTFYNLYKNLKLNLKGRNFKNFSIDLSVTIFFIINNFLKVIYFPLIIIIYFSKYRFVQLNYSQIGVSNFHLEFMVKKNLNDGYKSIIFIPKNSKVFYIKKIFKNLIIIDSIFLNLICLPLKSSSLISCKAEQVDHLIDNNFEYIKVSPISNICKIFKSKNLNKNIFKFKDDYLKKMKLYINQKFSKIDINKTYIFHHREPGYNNTSYMRGSNIKNYLPSIKYLLSKGYSVIRLTHSTAKKLNITNTNYYEVNTDKYINKMLQYYLIYKSRGLLCSSSGPGSIGSLLSKPVYHINSVGINVHATNKYGIYLLKKIKLNKKTISFKYAIKNNYFKFYLSTRYSIKKGYSVIENTPEEILEGLKEFINVKRNNKTSKLQKKFKKLLPSYMELKLYDSNISKNFILKNKKLFLDLIN